MPNIGELAAQLIRLLADAVGSSSLRLGAAPTIGILLVLLGLLSLLARPSARWAAEDLGQLAQAGRAMALAAESGTDAAVSLAGAGVVRSAAAVDRFQTLGSLPLLGHLAGAAARAGVPLQVTTNDPVAALLAAGTLASAHRRTATPERASASTVEYIGEGRALAAASAMAGARRHGVAAVAGGMAEEGFLQLDATLADADWGVAGTASAGQAAGPLLTADGSLIGPELLQVSGEVATSGSARAAVLAANRIVWTVVVVLLLGAAVAWAGGPQVAEFLVGR